MGMAIVDIVELVGSDGALGQLGIELFRQTLQDFYIIVRVSIGLGRNFDQLGAIEAQRILFSGSRSQGLQSPT